MGSPVYGLLMLAGIVIGVIFWTRLAKRDDRLMLIYITALLSAFIGAKLAYLFAEGWMDIGQPHQWARLATGKSITGGLLFGYLGVEIAKKHFGIRQITGDWFATIVPIAIGLGRIGCFVNGCCQGNICNVEWLRRIDRFGEPRYPSALIEVLFNMCALITFWTWRRRGKLSGQHFHIYLIAYGTFRFVTEFWRITPKPFLGLSGYQILALALVALGSWRFAERKRLLALETETHETAAVQLN